LIDFQPPETSSLAQKVEAGKWIQQHENAENSLGVQIGDP